tara:strand:- start:494 stop:1186 length:693 start_codon:yes stop_codon:yes gene_type:complete
MSSQLKSENLSVIIRNKNEERWIGHAIQSVIDLVDRPEIIVIDNNSTDNSLNIVKNFMQDPLLNKKNSRNYTKVKIINIKDYTPGKSINLGVKNSKKDYILIMSAHCVLKKINIDSLKKKIKKYCGIFGNQNPIWNGKKITKRYIWSHFIEKEKENMFSNLENRYFFHNAISFFSRKTLKKKPFDEFIQGKEDRYWINQRVKEREKFLYDPSILVDHHYTVDGNTWKGIG